MKRLLDLTAAYMETHPYRAVALAVVIVAALWGLRAATCPHGAFHPCF